MKKFLAEFKEFISRGNVVDLAVGVVIGGAFGKIVSSLVADIITPLIALVTGGVSFVEKYIPLNTPDGWEGAFPATATEAVEKGFNILTYGNFIQTIIDFLIVSFCIFLFLKGFMALQSKFKKQKTEEAAEAAPAEPSEEILLLREIRDSLKK